MDASLLVGTGNYYFWEPGGNLVGSDFSEDNPIAVVGVFSISSFAYLVSKPKINKKRILKIRSILRDKLPI